MNRLNSVFSIAVDGTVNTVLLCSGERVYAAYIPVLLSDIISDTHAGSRGLRDVCTAL